MRTATLVALLPLLLAAPLPIKRQLLDGIAGPVAHILPTDSGAEGPVPVGSGGGLLGGILPQGQAGEGPVLGLIPTSGESPVENLMGSNDSPLSGLLADSGPAHSLLSPITDILDPVSNVLELAVPTKLICADLSSIVPDLNLGVGVCACIGLGDGTRDMWVGRDGKGLEGDILARVDMTGLGDKIRQSGRQDLYPQFTVPTCDGQGGYICPEDCQEDDGSCGPARPRFLAHPFRPRPSSDPSPSASTIGEPIPAPSSESSDTPSSQPEASPSPEPGSEPEPTPSPQPQPVPESTPEAVPETSPEITPGPTSETTPEPTPETTPESLPETSPEATPETGPESTPATPENTPEPTPESTPEKDEDAPASAPVPVPDADAETNPDNNTEENPVPAPEDNSKSSEPALPISTPESDVVPTPTQPQIDTTQPVVDLPQTPGTEVATPGIDGTVGINSVPIDNDGSGTEPSGELVDAVATTLEATPTPSPVAGGPSNVEIMQVVTVPVTVEQVTVTVTSTVTETPAPAETTTVTTTTTEISATTTTATATRTATVTQIETVHDCAQPSPSPSSSFTSSTPTPTLTSSAEPTSSPVFSSSDSSSATPEPTSLVDTSFPRPAFRPVRPICPTREEFKDTRCCRVDMYEVEGECRCLPGKLNNLSLGLCLDLDLCLTGLVNGECAPGDLGNLGNLGLEAALPLGLGRAII